MRLDKFICKSTQLTRAEAKAAIKSGRVKINGWYDCHEATQVHENNIITLDGEILQARPSRYLMLHKPAGFVSSNVGGRYPSLFENLTLDDSTCLLYTSPSPRDGLLSRMPSSA